MADYVSIEQAREFLRAGDSTQEDELQLCVNAATKACIAYMNRDLSSQSFTEKKNGLGGAALPLKNFPITAISACSISDVAIDVTGLAFDDCMVYRKSGFFPKGNINVSITYTAGLAEIPEDVQMAVLYTAKGMWDARRTDMNTSSESYSGVSSAGFWPDGPGAVPPQAKALLNDYRAVFFG